jgi:hypothetical protein
MGGMVNEPWFPLAAIAAGMAFPAAAGAASSAAAGGAAAGGATAGTLSGTIGPAAGYAVPGAATLAGGAASAAPAWAGLIPSANTLSMLGKAGAAIGPQLMAQAQQPPITPAPPVIPQMQPRGPAPSLASALGSPPFGMPPTTAVPQQLA